MHTWTDEAKNEKLIVVQQEGGRQKREWRQRSLTTKIA